MATGFPTKANWAAGDVLTASALDDLAGTVNLLSNASATTGSQLVSNAAGTSFAYQPTPSASNPVLNSAFQIWQRGTSISVSASVNNSYTADRWALSTGVNQACTVSRQLTNDTTNLPSIQYCSRVQRNAGQTGTAQISFDQSLETFNSIPFAGKTVTVSYYARVGATFSGTPTNQVPMQVISGTGTDQNVGTASGIAVLATSVATLTTTWQRVSTTAAVGSTATQLFLRYAFTPTGTAGATDYFEVTGVQIDVGSVALPFRTAGTSYQQELALCQRYLPAVLVGSGNRAFGYAVSTTSSYVNITFPVTARTAPTGITPSTMPNFTLLTSAGGTGTPTNMTFDSSGVNSASLTLTSTAASPTIAANTSVQVASITSSSYVLFTGCEL